MKEILITSIAFSPNVGGIETHFNDLTKTLVKRGWKVSVLTYKPITTNVKAKTFEKIDNKVTIIRIPWFGGLFYKLVKNPALEFIYLVPGLFFGLPIYLLVFGKKLKTIHSHGLVAGFASVFWGKVFGKRVITTTHSIYHFPKSGLYKSLSRWIFGNSDCVLTLSKQSAREIEKLGIEKKKITVFTYWINLDKFKVKSEKFKIKKKLGWEGKKFVVLFVGRLVEEKGVGELLDAARMWDKDIMLAIAGTGPLEEMINEQKSINKNILYLERVDNDKLPDYYYAADLVIVPSTHEEGFGRVILESLACGTPVIGSNRGAIPEAMDETVGEFIKVTPVEIKKAVEYFYNNLDKLEILSRNARKFAEKRYSEKNSDKIVETYN